MKRVLVGPIVVRHPADQGLQIYIEGGWYAHVPEIDIDDRALQAYARVLGTPTEARRIHQQLYESAFVESLRLAIARRAQQYAKMWPQHVTARVRDYKTSKRFVTLRGFDPAQLQGTFVPYDITGRAGNEAARDMLTEMGKEAE